MSNPDELEPYAKFGEVMSSEAMRQRDVKSLLVRTQQLARPAKGDQGVCRSETTHIATPGGDVAVQLLWKDDDRTVAYLVKQGDPFEAAIAQIDSLELSARTTDLDARQFDPQELLELLQRIHARTSQAAEQRRRHRWDWLRSIGEWFEDVRDWISWNGEVIGGITAAVVILGLVITFAIWAGVSESNKYTKQAMTGTVYAPTGKTFTPKWSDQYDGKQVAMLSYDDAKVLPSSSPRSLDIPSSGDDRCSVTQRVIRPTDRFRIIQTGTDNATVKVDAQTDEITVCRTTKRDSPGQIILQGVHGK